jgi:hypothetical protein
MKFLVLLTFIPFLLILEDCASPKGEVIAKVKGLKIYQADLDSLFGSIKDEKDRVKKIKNHIKEKVDEQVLYNQALRMGFHRNDTNKAILNNIQIIETANWYISEVLKKNWGFLEKEVVKKYNADREKYRKKEPKLDSVPTDAQKKALADFQKDPYKSLDVVRGKVLRSLLLAKSENKKAISDLVASMKDSVDSMKIQNKEDDIINDHVNDLENREYENLKEANKVEIYDYVPDIKEEELKAEWEKTKTSYKRKPDIEVQHIEVKSKKTARKIVDWVNNKNRDFFKLQRKHTICKSTLGKTFKVYGDEKIEGLPGDTRSVYPRVSYVPVGKASNPIGLKPEPKLETYHIFKVISKEEESIKTFEEAKPDVHKSLFAKKQLSIPLESGLAKVKGKIITAGQVFTLLYKMSPMVVNRYKTEEGRKSLVEKYYLRFLLFDQFAQERGVDKDKALMTKIENSQKRFLL